MAIFLEKFNFLLTILSPLHIGCDEVYEPFSFRIAEDEKKLIHFDQFNFLDSLNQQDRLKFTGFCKQGRISSILEIYKLMAKSNISGRRVQLCEGFIDHYRQTLGINTRNEHAVQQNLNNFIIARTAFNPYKEQPYIPGSSIKGALRTAWLNRLPQAELTPAIDYSKKGGLNREALRLEKHLLDYDQFHVDPFRLVKVSDFMPAGQIEAKIRYSVNIKKRPTNYEPQGLPILVETVESGSAFLGSITIQRQGRDIKDRDRINAPIAGDELLFQSNEFYQKEKKREDRELSSLGITTPAAVDGGLIRLGRHSGAECVTIEGFRDIKIMKAKGEGSEYKSGATTIWLAAERRTQNPLSDLKPFGWAIIKPISEEEVSNYLAKIIAGPEEGTDMPPELGTPELPSSDQVFHEGTECWPEAVVTYAPGSRTITAQYQGRKAESRNPELVPDKYRKKLIDKKSAVTAPVEVKKLGNLLELVKIR
ncbi:MAG: type III-A CRISPR-associated RAMP protein Csm5 [Deltaproteobacteria bacterium]|nr:type III-A CRISPR-associated RAMP protein Csm5 [Deltaproteobacteria bacterium]